MPSSTAIRLLKCPACGGPLDLLTGESSMKCLFCGNTVVIPENLRVAKQPSQPVASIFDSMDRNTLLGHGSEWAGIVSMAQSGNKTEAVKKYMALSGVSESDASYTVDVLANSQSYDAAQMAVASAYWSNPNVLSKMMGLSLASSGISLLAGCAIVVVILIAILAVTIPILIKVFGSF